MIISGGQTGADRAALDFALANGIHCSGWCPRGRRAEDGQIEEKYPLLEAKSELYQHRTRLNVKDADATLIINDGSYSRGTELTLKCATQYEKPVIVITGTDESELVRLLTWLNRYRPIILNIAGPRGSEGSAIYQLTTMILDKTLKKSRQKPPEWPPTQPITKNLF